VVLLVVTEVFDAYSVDQEVVAEVFHAVLVFLESSTVVEVLLDVLQVVELTPDQAVEVSLSVVTSVLVLRLFDHVVVSLVFQTVVVGAVVFQVVVPVQAVVVLLLVVAVVFTIPPHEVEVVAEVTLDVLTMSSHEVV
jgi:hypothetical protein